MFRICTTDAQLSGRLPRRRDFLRLGGLGLAGLGVAGLSLPTLLAQPKSTIAPGASFGRAKRCLLLFLTGGPPQHDTFDPKPKAPPEIRGELRPIATKTPGLQFSELFPKLAQQSDKLCVVRSLTHHDTVHTSAGYSILTGYPHSLANAKTATDIQPKPEDHPHLGSILSLARPSLDGTPRFVSLPEVIKDAAVNEFPGQGAGFLGKKFDPLRIEATPQRTAFIPPDIILPQDMTPARLADRRLLQGRLNESLKQAEMPAAIGELETQYVRALDLLRSPGVPRAFRLDDEPAKTRASYGEHLFGQGCLLGRRLLEAGVSLVTVYWHYEGPDDSPVWDTHENNFPHLRNRLAAPADAAAATLLADLESRGMLADTLVMVLGEFGRSPRVNGKGGRDHWPHVQSILLAGARLPAGTAYGTSDAQGGYPAAHALTPADLSATVLHLLGVPPALELQDQFGRPFRACEGTPVAGLVGG